MKRLINRYWLQQENEKMNNELDVIKTLEELEQFLISVEAGGLGLEGVEGVGMATNNSDGRHFVAVFNSSHQVLLARWITDEVFENGKDLVRNGPRRSH
ncbi:conserved hypothetical protein [Vibrio chagasii]|nr:conserved hypothetical protein [Vibrio chagasii]CAH6820311.1 conserved hypothetical protein [Vibrio chagasii]CAH6824196.1 conserved hypothetical protein [Vibrio chagasii]CAH6973528.1 conserved hypothetical protein [Vibrio chagasii]CAH6992214.1 conserved hypothetical protein [Vibrio chagasii]